MTTHFPWLTCIIFLPLAGSFLALCLGHKPKLCRWTSFLVSLADLFLIALSFALNLRRQSGADGKWVLAEDHAWIESLGIHYSLGLDGISLMLILLTAFLTVLCVLVSWKEINTGVGTFHFFLLLMETSVMGVFLATDLFLFYLFQDGRKLVLPQVLKDLSLAIHPLFHLHAEMAGDQG